MDKHERRQLFSVKHEKNGILGRACPDQWKKIWSTKQEKFRRFSREQTFKGCEMGQGEWMFIDTHEFDSFKGQVCIDEAEWLTCTERLWRGQCAPGIPYLRRAISQSELYCGFKSHFCLKYSIYLIHHDSIYPSSKTVFM